MIRRYLLLLICLACFVVAGCSSSDADSQDSNVSKQSNQQTTKPEIESKPAQTKVTSSSTGTESNVFGLPEIFAADLRYTPSHAYAVAVMRPGLMSELEGVQGIPEADLAGRNPFKPSEIERAVATIYPEGMSRQLQFGFVIHLRVDVPREKIVRCRCSKMRTMSFVRGPLTSLEIPEMTSMSTH